MIFEVINPGLLTTIQDLGRKGYQKYGLAVSGAADHYAHQMANIIVCNFKDAACLEITLMGLKMKVLKSTIVAITGGNLDPHVNEKPIEMWTSLELKEGDIISFRGCISGSRSYLAVLGGIAADDVLGSKSTDEVGKIGGINGRGLRKNDIIRVNSLTESKELVRVRRLPPNLIPNYPNKAKIRVLLGPQKEAFTKKGINNFLTNKYTVSINSDRMACRLDGPIIEHKSSADIISEGIFFGAIQVPKNGLPILFQVGRQSVGGYTKIAGVITVDLPKVAQLKPGDSIIFEEVTIQEAHRLLIEKENVFNYLRASF